MNPKVSILIPIFKSELYISQCLRSVLEQTYQNLEIVIVDDASPDGSMAIVESMLEHVSENIDIKIIHHERNQKIASTRNTLLDNATGDYILFVDSDDFIELHAIETLVNMAEKTNADIIRCSYYEDKGNDTRVVHLPSFIDKDDLLRHHIGAWNSIEALWQLFIRRKLIEDYHLRFAKDINASEDHLMILKLFYYADIIVETKTPFYHYRSNNAQSLTHTNGTAFHDSMYKGMDAAICFLKENGAYETYRDEVLTRTFLTKQTFLLNKLNRDIDLYVNTHPECNSYYRKFNYNWFQRLLFRLAEHGHSKILKLIT